MEINCCHKPLSIANNIAENIHAQIFKHIYLYYLMYMIILPTCLNIHHVHAWGILFPGNGIMDFCKPPYG